MSWKCWLTHSWRDLGEFRQCLRCKLTQRRCWYQDGYGDYHSEWKDAR